MSPEAGVIPRAIHQIFQHLDSIDSDYTVKCSFLELYNEETTDLLAVGASASPEPYRGGACLGAVPLAVSNGLLMVVYPL